MGERINDVEQRAIQWALNENYLASICPPQTNRTGWSSIDEFRNARELEIAVHHQTKFEKAFLADVCDPRVDTNRFDFPPLDEVRTAFMEGIAQQDEVASLLNEHAKAACLQSNDSNSASKAGSASTKHNDSPLVADAHVCDTQSKQWEHLCSLPVRRSNPLDGKLLTYEEFVGLFGVHGTYYWDKCNEFRYERRIIRSYSDDFLPKDAFGHRCAKRLANKVEFETQYRDDGATWDATGKHQFIDLSLDFDGSVPCERRMAYDNKYYTKLEFEEYYEDNGHMWQIMGKIGMQTKLAWPPTATALFPCAYLLIADDTTNYMGSTVNLKHRMKQHMGVIKGGAELTSKHKDWRIVVFVYGFVDYYAAHKFESDWLCPEKAFTLTPIERSSQRLLHHRKLTDNLEVLQLLLRSNRSLSVESGVRWNDLLDCKQLKDTDRLIVKEQCGIDW